MPILFKKGDLRSHLDKYHAKHENIEKETLIKWFKQIVLGLKELHHHNSHHRDLKTGLD